jgi:predicted amidohydrolase
MKVGFIQTNPALAQLERNVTRIEDLVCQAMGAELLVLPELCHTGYRFESRQQAWELSEKIEGSNYLNRLQKVCAERQFHIVTGFNERDGEKLFNTAVLIGPSGVVGKYRKMHLFMDEKDIFEPGDLGLPVFDIGTCRIGLLICFDWIFPEVWRILALKGADIICHPSNLVIPGLCQKAIPVHAVCNRVFVITANRIGTERDLTFTGLSTIADPKANILIQASPDRDEVGLVDVDIALARNKNTTPRNHVFDDRRPNEYRRLLEE